MFAFNFDIGKEEEEENFVFQSLWHLRLTTEYTHQIFLILFIDSIILRRAHKEKKNKNIKRITTKDINSLVRFYGIFIGFLLSKNFNFAITNKFSMKLIRSDIFSFVYKKNNRTLQCVHRTQIRLSICRDRAVHVTNCIKIIIKDKNHNQK